MSAPPTSTQPIQGPILCLAVIILAQILVIFARVVVYHAECSGGGFCENGLFGSAE
jgi:hypothetical protein